MYVKFDMQTIRTLTGVYQIMFVYIYRISTKEVNTFSNLYFAMTVRKYKAIGIHLV